MNGYVDDTIRGFVTLMIGYLEDVVSMKHHKVWMR